MSTPLIVFLVIAILLGLLVLFLVWELWQVNRMVRMLNAENRALHDSNMHLLKEMFEVTRLMLGGRKSGNS